MTSPQSTAAGLPALLRVQEVAQALSLSTKQVRRLIKAGKLRAHRVGIRAIRIAEADLRAYLATTRRVKL
jgi:excisionase family DNA binding protein